MKKLIFVAGAAALAWGATALADPTNVPRENARARLARNAANNPDSQGLTNAQGRLLTNDTRQAPRGRNQAPGQQKKTTGAAERVERQTVERAETVDRVARVEPVQRPERAARPDRPDRPGKK